MTVLFLARSLGRAMAAITSWLLFPVCCNDSTRPCCPEDDTKTWWGFPQSIALQFLTSISCLVTDSHFSGITSFSAHSQYYCSHVLRRKLRLWRWPNIIWKAIIFSPVSQCLFQVLIFSETEATQQPLLLFSFLFFFKLLVRSDVRIGSVRGIDKYRCLSSYNKDTCLSNCLWIILLIKF